MKPVGCTCSLHCLCVLLILLDFLGCLRVVPIAAEFLRS